MSHHEAAAHEFRRRRRVEFAETDMAGIVHFSAYFRYMEETEHAFLRSLGLSAHGELDGERVGFPRLAARCEFSRPLRFEDEVDVELRVLRVGNRSISYQFRFELRGIEVARGEVTASCVRRLDDGGIESAPLPALFRARLTASPLAALEFGPRSRAATADRTAVGDAR